MSETVPVSWKKIYLDNDDRSSLLTNNNQITDVSTTNKQQPLGIQKRRKSSLNSLYSPFTRRRSFLSKNMIENESLQCYELSKYSVFYNDEDSDDGCSDYNNRRRNHDYEDNNIPSFSLSLSESQGFVWNQDLFATSYQQSKAGVNSTLSMSFNNRIGRETGFESHSVDVIDIIVNNDEYNSDVDLVTEIVKVVDDDDEYEDDYDDDYEEEEDFNDRYNVQHNNNNNNNNNGIGNINNNSSSVSGTRTNNINNNTHNSLHSFSTNSRQDMDIDDNSEEEEDEEEDEIFVADL